MGIRTKVQEAVHDAVAARIKPQRVASIPTTGTSAR